MSNRTVLTIKVIPKSSRSEIKADDAGAIRVYLHSPPADGKANEECIRLFSKVLGISKSGITIEKGLKGRNKIIVIDGISLDEAMDIINNHTRG